MKHIDNYAMCESFATWERVQVFALRTLFTCTVLLINLLLYFICLFGAANATCNLC